MADSPMDPQAPLDPLTRLRIIVADDDERMREFYTEVLTHLGHEVVGVAADGMELVEACRQNEADLVVTDIRMPRINGTEAARIVLGEIEVPFLFVTAYQEDLCGERAIESFNTGVLVKPIKQEDLAKTIPVAMRRFWER